jgi:ABC-type polar amino acid transport system ATPase subunit
MSNNPVQTSIIADGAIPCAAESNLKFLPLTCRIQPSQLTCLVGPHRSQLRTYLQMLAGISKPQQGKVEIFGQLVSELDHLAWRKLRCKIGYLSGGAPLLSAHHGLMNVMLPLLYHDNLSFREASDKARALMTELDCDCEPTAYPSQMNSFQQSQFALARALILDPCLLFLDVPFNDLGAKEREKMGGLLGKYKENRAVCMIGGFQYPHFLEQYANQIVFISEHKIINFNSWKSFLQTEDHDVQELLNVL